MKRARHEAQRGVPQVRTAPRALAIAVIGCRPKSFKGLQCGAGTLWFFRVALHGSKHVDEFVAMAAVPLDDVAGLSFSPDGPRSQPAAGASGADCDATDTHTACASGPGDAPNAAARHHAPHLWWQNRRQRRRAELVQRQLRFARSFMPRALCTYRVFTGGLPTPSNAGPLIQPVLAVVAIISLTGYRELIHWLEQRQTGQQPAADAGADARSSVHPPAHRDAGAGGSMLSALSAHLGGAFKVIRDHGGDVALMEGVQRGNRAVCCWPDSPGPACLPSLLLRAETVLH